ncbi:MAG TPA: hypothetical protein VE218_10845, partial [Acidobacteriaceae bacterium]|nr:hypothetical protein [Acidobacteriaceae bacterium]
MLPVYGWACAQAANLGWTFAEGEDELGRAGPAAQAAKLALTLLKVEMSSAGLGLRPRPTYGLPGFVRAAA